MIKILHTGDIHLGDLAGPTKDGENLRRRDTLNCMEAIFQKAFLENPNVTIIAGDLFNRSRVWADTALEDVNDALDAFIRPLCLCSDAVVLLFGTMNHDNPRAFELIKRATGELKNLYIYTEPKVETIGTTKGPVQIVAVPGFDKGRIRLFCPGVDKETENRNATALINDVVLGLSTELKKDIPSIMVAHYTVSGSEADNGSTFLAGQDVVILPSTIDATGVDLACFGHIHKPQKLGSTTPAYYCGSPNQLTFNDEGQDHGFWLHYIDRDIRGRVVTEWQQTPERKHKTVRLSDVDVAAFISTGTYNPPEDIKGAIVRIRYTCNTEQEKAFNRAELQKQIMAAGAFFVAEITPEDIEELDGKDQLTEHDGPTECLARWLDVNEITGDKAARLTELALPIIKEADDGRDAAKHTGAFIPKTIEVKNYRSYTQATFDFEPVHMAMVNGPNGVGKSSLFMDAMADCLFEQTRKEDIGGWVRDGTKSGSVTFTFAMGGQDYRVIRTRTKSGRGTLALHRFDSDANTWADESDTTMKLTQAKIERLLGMDCNTFCSIALIRQDAYGLFLDADSDRRMEVLSALLGLDVYNRMNDLARARAKELRQQIAAAKERVNILSDKLAAKDELVELDAYLHREIEKAEASIKAAETELEILKGAEALRLEIVHQAEAKEQETERYRAERRQKAAESDRLMLEYNNALQTANGLEEAREATEKVKAARALIAEKEPLVAEDTALLKERGFITGELEADTAKLRKLMGEKQSATFDLGLSAGIRAAKDELERLTEKKQSIQARVAEAAKAAEATAEAKQARDSFLAESRIRIGKLDAEYLALKAEADKLIGSGCPDLKNARCKFLRSAVEAEAKLPELTARLDALKSSDRAEYTKLDEAFKAAKEAIDALGNPAAQLVELDTEERKVREVLANEPIVAAAKAKIEELDVSIAELKSEIKQKEARLREIDLRRTDAEMNMALTLTLEARHVIETCERVAETLAAREAAKAKADALVPQTTRIQDECFELARKAEQSEKEALEIRARVPAADTTTDALRGIVNEHRQQANDCTHRRGTVAARLEDIAEAEKQIATLRAEVEQIAAKLDDYTTLGQAFSIDGIPYMIIRGVVPEIMRRSNDILAAMTGGRMAVDIRTEREQKSTKQIVNSLEVWINTITGGTRPYQSHSGGEKVKIALAVTLGLADVKARRAGVQLGMLFIDEPPFLDGDGTEAYADALVSMGTRNPNMRILAISHDPTMKARFNQNIVVTGGEDGSTATME